MTQPKPFRLVRAELWDERDDAPEMDVDLAPRQAYDSWTTLITGQNGSGKSRLISAVASAFDVLGGRSLRKRQPIALEYLFDGRECAFRVDGKRVAAFLDGRVVDAESLPRPRAVIAATASAFDKFHLPREDRLVDSTVTDTQYKYLGLKDARGRVSARAGVFRALEQLFDASAEEYHRRQRVSDVFRYLGYSPTVQVTYRWTDRGMVLASPTGADSVGAVERFLQNEKARATNSARATLPNYFFQDGLAVRELAASVDVLREFSYGREVELVADFRHRNARGDQQLKMARQLSRAGIVQLAEVTLERESSGRRIEITDASSGELSLAVTQLGIASSIEDGSLVLIDEPEISLHPQWQSEYLGRLAEAFSAFRGCHFVVATHSPTLVAGAAPGMTSIVDLEKSEGNIEEAPPARSVDEVLFSTFGVVTKNSLHLRDLLVAALRGAEDGDLATPKYDEEMAALRSARPSLPRDDPAGQLIDRLARIRIKLAARSAS